MRVFVSKRKLDDRTWAYDYRAERVEEGTITVESSSGHDESVRTNLRQRFCEVIIYDEASRS